MALLIVVLGLIGVPIAMLNTLNKIAALLLVNIPEQMMFFLNLNAQGIFIASIFWGLWLLPKSVLIYMSGYFPKIFSILMIIAGFAYFTGSFVNLLFPHLTRIISTLDMLTMGEVIFMIWVIIRGAKLPKINSKLG